MQEQKCSELETRATTFSTELDAFKKQEARAIIHHEMELMKEEGAVLILTAEEDDMLHSFRRFRLRMHKQVETFTWQTTQSKYVEIAENTALIVHPQE